MEAVAITRKYTPLFMKCPFLDSFLLIQVREGYVYIHI
jgi:hypothetical protein